MPRLSRFSRWTALWFVALFLAACGHDAVAPGASSGSTTSVNAAAASASSTGQVTVPASDAAPPAAQTDGFDGARAYDQVAKFVSFGPHPSGSEANRNVQNYIRAQLQSFGCAADEDSFIAPSPMGNLPMVNIVAKIPGTGQGIILLMTHYDTKRVDNFVGAEDGGSSTGLMLEMARVLCGQPKRANAVWIAFLDGEETQAQFDWSDPDSTYGSRELAARMAVSGDLKRIRALILADMIGQYNLHILRDATAPKWLSDMVWSTAARLGYQAAFVSSETGMSDDHVPFLKRGVPSIDLIDLLDYQNMGYWHTAQDTLDKVSPRSLAIVGHVILESVNELQNKFR